MRKKRRGAKGAGSGWFDGEKERAGFSGEGASRKRLGLGWLVDWQLLIGPNAIGEKLQAPPLIQASRPLGFATAGAKYSLKGIRNMNIDPGKDLFV